MIKIGIYQGAIPREYVEKHGGVTIRKNIYWNIGLYEDNSMIIYGSDRNEHWQFKKKRSAMKIEMTSMSDDELIAKVMDENTGEVGYLQMNQSIDGILNVVSKNANGNLDGWLDDKFIYVDLDYLSF